MVWAKAQAKENMRKVVNETRRTIFLPKMSDQRPYNGVNDKLHTPSATFSRSMHQYTNLVSRYAVATHELSLPACRLEEIRGSAVAMLMEDS
jgi:hypothetical protein